MDTNSGNERTDYWYVRISWQSLFSCSHSSAIAQLTFCSDNAQIIWNASNRVDWIVITTDHGIEEGAQDAIENRFSAALTHIKPRGPQSPSLDPKLVKKDLITESGRFYSRERALMDLLEFTEQETLGWCEDNWDKPVNSDDSDGGEGQEELQDE